LGQLKFLCGTTQRSITREQQEVRMLPAFRRLLADQTGATAIEYGLICALISIVLIIAFDVGDSLIASLQLLIPALR
jgi:Flp pilus assembly pilin Flp